MATTTKHLDAASDARILRTIAREDLIYALQHPETFDPAQLRAVLSALPEPPADEIAGIEAALEDSQ
jgi:hypothetical protein